MSRFIAYKNISAIIWIVVSIIFIILSITLGVIICKKIKNYYNDKQGYAWESDRNFGYGLTWFCAGTIILAFIIILFCNINGIFKNVYLPETIVIEYINNLTSMGG